MQYFGKYDTMFDDEFLVQSYFYFTKDDEEPLTPQQFRELIKNKKLKKSNIAGTIIMYNPYVAPIGYDEKKDLAKQDFDFDSGYVELKIERENTLFKSNIKGYEGKIIEVRNMFNLNTHNINKPETLIALNDDLGKLHTSQLTTYERNMNYIDINSLTINGKFIFFAWGNKINRAEFSYIFDYAQAIYDKCVQTQKKIAFIYRRSTQEHKAIEKLHFLYPYELGKFKNALSKSIKNAFSTNPPISTFLDDKGV